MRHQHGEGRDEDTQARDRSVDELFAETQRAMRELEAALADLAAKVLDHA